MPKKPSANDKLGLLASHAGDKNVKFNEPVLHGALRFGKGEVVDFECREAAGYFDVAFNGTELVDTKATRTVTLDEFNTDPKKEGETIDPDTRIGSGREGVVPGLTVAMVLGGAEPDGADGTLAVDDVHSTVEG